LRILICNHRYFVSGGPERYMFNVMDILRSHGHHVVPFSIDYERNEPTEYSRYFVSPPAGRDHVSYAEKPLGARQKARMLSKTLYNFEARKRVMEAIKAERIELVYTLQTVNFLYPGIVDGAYKACVPIVARLSDYQLLCPSYVFFRDGRVCEDCKGGFYHALKKPCMQGSRAVTAARVLAMYLQRRMGTSKKVSMFVAPSRFLRDKLIEYGYPRDKVHWVPTPVDTASHVPEYEPGGYALYVGNTREYKGVDVLVRAFGGIPGLRLKIAGISSAAEARTLEDLARDSGADNVEFLGFKDMDELEGLYRGASFVVVPSLWYENTPNVVLEAMAYGKPVLASNLGSMPELVVDGKTGVLFRPGDPADLRKKAVGLVSDRDALVEMGRNARRLVEDGYSKEVHYDMLTGIFEKALAGRSRAADRHECIKEGARR